MLREIPLLEKGQNVMKERMSFIVFFGTGTKVVQHPKV
jgi:hypothetical protein